MVSGSGELASKRICLGKENSLADANQLQLKKQASLGATRPALAARSTNVAAASPNNAFERPSLIKQARKHPHHGPQTLDSAGIGGRKRPLDGARLASRTGSFTVRPEIFDINATKAIASVPEKQLSRKQSRPASRGSAFYPRPQVPADLADLPIDDYATGPPPMDDEPDIDFEILPYEPEFPRTMSEEAVKRVLEATTMSLEDFPDLEVDLSETSFGSEV